MLRVADRTEIDSESMDISEENEARFRSDQSEFNHDSPFSGHRQGIGGWFPRELFKFR